MEGTSFAALVLDTLIGVAMLALFYGRGMLRGKELRKMGVWLLLAGLGLGGFLACWLGHQQLAHVLLAVTFILCGINACISGFLRDVYGMHPDSGEAVDALTNTHAQEAAQFLSANRHAIARQLFAGLSIVLAALLLMCGWKAWDAQVLSALAPVELAATWVSAPLLAVFVLLHLNRPLSFAHPLLGWPWRYFHHRHVQRLVQEEIREVRRTLHQKEQDSGGRDWSIRCGAPPTHTMVLVLGESSTRRNWSLYGYARPTTPCLDARRSELLIFDDVMSSDPCTGPSLQKMLSGAQLRNPEGWREAPDVLSLARGAGYKTLWLSNQGMMPWPGVVADGADTRIFLPELPASGKGGGDWDERVLPHFEAMLDDPAPRKLIVIHLMGAHTEYKKRYPPAFSYFDGIDDDAVARAMREARCARWVIEQRNRYDNAIRYGDALLERMIDSLKAGHGKGERATLLFVSDHGQQIGHHGNYAGHAPHHSVGYEIPLVLWRNDGFDDLGFAAGATVHRPYQTDQLNHMVSRLLGIESRFYEAERDILSQHFEPLPHCLPKLETVMLQRHTSALIRCARRIFPLRPQPRGPS